MNDIDTNEIIKEIIKLPIIALRGTVAFPSTSVTFDLSRTKSIEALETAMLDNKKLFVVSQLNIIDDEVDIDGLYSIGIVIQVKQTVRLANGIIRVVADGLNKAKLLNLTEKTKYLAGEIQYIDEQTSLNDIEDEAIFDMLNEVFEQYAGLSSRLTPDVIMEIISTQGTYSLTNLIVSKLPLKYNEKQEVLEIDNLKEKAMHLLKILNKEIELLNIQREINTKVKTKIDKSQREYYLREQVKTIQEELGDKENIQSEFDEYADRIEKANLPENVKEKATKELKRLRRISSSSSESVLARDYIELILDLPWTEKSKESKNLEKAEKILNSNHFGLEKVKERIIEFLAVRQKTEGKESPILCLVGPPGVGKTSIAKSVAKALNRKYIRMSLGGIRDEAEIRGHRKTYIGAMPGRFITALKQAQTNNPLILLDEIDKISSDYKGDPASALLEILDAEQNFSFRDNYLELPFDLSDVLFMCTANDLSSTPPALRDRFEIIRLSSYTDREKLNIAKKYLVEKELNKNGLEKSELKIKESAIKEIISYYTREAGVRNLERQIGQICRKVVKEILEGAETPITVSKDNVADYLGKQKFKVEAISHKAEVGTVRGLAWTSVGGATLTVDVNVMKGSGKFNITGNIGKVMQESAQASISYIRANCKKLNIRPDFYKDTDIHIHIPEGAVPKDGPSAGVTMTTAVISALTETPVRNDVAMTGEISIRGKVLPIGGLKEKILAAKKVGIKKIIIPIDNKPDLDELEDYVKKNLEFVLAKNIQDVIDNAFVI